MKKIKVKESKYEKGPALCLLHSHLHLGSDTLHHMCDLAIHNHINRLKEERSKLFSQMHNCPFLAVFVHDVSSLPFIVRLTDTWMRA